MTPTKAQSTRKGGNVKELFAPTNILNLYSIFMVASRAFDVVSMCAAGPEKFRAFSLLLNSLVSDASLRAGADNQLFSALRSFWPQVHISQI